MGGIILQVENEYNATINKQIGRKQNQTKTRRHFKYCQYEIVPKTKRGKGNANDFQFKDEMIHYY